MFERFKRGMFYEAEGGAGSAGDAEDGKQQGDKFEGWLKDQPDEVKTLLDSHTSGLKSALKSEREARSKAEKDLRELAGKAEKGSEAEQKLIEMADQMAENDRRAEFYEEAHRAGVTNLKLAYILAVQEERFDKRGRVDFAALKEEYPEIFGMKKVANGNAGNGTGDDKKPGAGDMNAWIRKAAGRG